MAVITKKLTEQYVDLFCIVKKLGRLAYRLNMPPNWWIHPIFSVIQLELAPPPAKDLFARLFPSNPLLIFVKGNTNKVKSFEIERLLNKCQVKKGKNRVIEYLVCWKRYSPE